MTNCVDVLFYRQWTMRTWRRWWRHLEKTRHFKSWDSAIMVLCLYPRGSVIVLCLALDEIHLCLKRLSALNLSSGIAPLMVGWCVVLWRLNVASYMNKKVFEQFTQHIRHTIYQDVSTRRFSSTEEDPLVEMSWFIVWHLRMLRELAQKTFSFRLVYVSHILCDSVGCSAVLW